MSRTNVRQRIILTDTVLVSKWVGQIPDRPQGWYTTFLDVGNAGVLNFMNVRNRSVGLAWNNQDARDAMPWGMRIWSIGVKFFAPTCASQFTACDCDAIAPLDCEPYPDTDTDDPTYTYLMNREELHSALWESDLPNHCSLTLRTNQDIRLKGPLALFTPGYGPVGGGWGWGSPGTWINNGELSANTIACGEQVTNLQTIEHGEVDLRQRFLFPTNLDIPKRANLSVEIKLSQYARSLLTLIPGPFWHSLPHSQGEEGVEKRARAALFGVQVTLDGEQLIQQRGDYSV